MAIFNPNKENKSQFFNTQSRQLSRGLIGGLFPTLPFASTLTPQNLVRDVATRAVQRQQRPATNATRVPSSMMPQQTSAPSRQRTAAPRASAGQAPAAAQAPAPSPEPVADTSGNLESAMARLEQVIRANEGRDLSLAERESLVQSVASSRNAPELVGTEAAARFINAPGPSRRERVERESGVVTAEPAREQMEITGREVDSRLQEFATPEFELGAEADIQALYDERLALSDAQLQDRLEQIRQTFARQREQTQELNRRLQGGTGAFIGRAGAFSSASGQGAIQQAAEDADARMAQLAADEASALAQAQAAKDANDLAALNEFIKQANALRQERNSLAQQSFSNLLAAGEAERAMRADEVAMASQSVNFLQQLTPDQLDEVDREYLGGLETQLNLPSGYFESFADNLRAANQAQTEQARFESTMQILDFAKDVPAGFQFQIGDEVYTGLKGGGGKSYSVQDGMGNTSFITIDEDTGQLMNSFTLPVGQRRVVSSSSRSNRTISGNQPALGTEQFIYLTSAREFMGRPVSEFLQSMGVSQEAAANIVGDPTAPLTIPDALSIGYATEILPADIDLNDYDNYAAQMNPDYYVQRSQDQQGNDVFLYAPKDQAPSPNNIHQVVIPQQEKRGILEWAGEGIKTFLGF